MYVPGDTGKKRRGKNHKKRPVKWISKKKNPLEYAWQACLEVIKIFNSGEENEVKKEVKRTGKIQIFIKGKFRKWKYWEKAYTQYK